MLHLTPTLSVKCEHLPVAFKSKKQSRDKGKGENKGIY